MIGGICLLIATLNPTKFSADAFVGFGFLFLFEIPIELSFVLMMMGVM